MAAAAPDPAAQLVKLRQPEPFRMLDHHHRRRRHVDAHFDHRGGHQDAGLAGREARHRRILVGALHAPVDEIDRGAENLAERGKALLRGGEVAGLRFLHQRTDPVDAAALADARGRPRRPPRRGGRAAPCGCRWGGGRRAFPAAPRLPCRRSRSAPGCAGSGSRSSPGRRPHGPCAPARAAGGRRSGAARRRWRGRDRGTRPRPGTAHGCRSGGRCRRRRGGRECRRGRGRARVR